MKLWLPVSRMALFPVVVVLKDRICGSGMGGSWNHSSFSFGRKDLQTLSLIAVITLLPQGLLTSKLMVCLLIMHGEGVLVAMVMYV